MDKNEKLFFLLLRAALNPAVAIDTAELAAAWGGGIENAPDWDGVYNLALSQGVLVVVWDGYMRLYNEGLLSDSSQMSRQLKLKWFGQVDAFENRAKSRLQTAAAFSDALDKEGIRVVVLKGVACAIYYPNIWSREYGDLDCFLGPDYERGNSIAERIGAEVSRGYYKHSHITYQGLSIENHQFCLPIRGRRVVKEAERHLEKIALDDPIHYFPRTKLIVPSADFNALFLMTHAFNHFISEGIKIRHICDWALLVGKEQNNIDWTVFYGCCNRLGIKRFADALTAIAVKCLGLRITCPDIITESEYDRRILENTLYCNSSAFNKGYAAWKTRLQVVRNQIASIWKYHQIYRRSFCVETLRAVWGFLFERLPRL